MDHSVRPLLTGLCRAESRRFEHRIVHYTFYRYRRVQYDGPSGRRTSVRARLVSTVPVPALVLFHAKAIR